MAHSQLDVWRRPGHVYGPRFQSVLFLIILSSGCYEEELAIPQTFIDNVREKLTLFVTIRIQSGKTWIVGLATRAETYFFKFGWKKFVQDNFLEINDILMFEYKGDARFDVTLRSNHIRRGGHMKRIQPMRSVVNKSRANKNLQSRSLTNGASTRAMQLKSNRRPVNDQEKGKALRLACASLTANTFLVVMRPSHVYKGFCMAVPASWARRNLPPKSCNILLQINGKAWEVRFFHRKSCSRLAGGWKKFAMDNYLEESDVGVFKLIDGTGNYPYVIDVSIFRVVDEVIPLSRMSHGASTSRSSEAE